MAQEQQAPGKDPTERSRAALDFVHRLLAPSSAESVSLTGLLRDLASAFAAEAAGVAGLTDGTPAHRGRVALSEGPAPVPPWAEQPRLLAQVCAEASALVVPSPTGPFLCAAVCPREGAGWLLWLEGARGRDWSGAEAAALALAAQAVARRLGDQRQDAPAWARHLEHAARQRRLEDVALVTRRLAHDYGNVLTSILGFTELSLSQLTADSPLKRYLAEVHRGCQQGALLTHRLRLFARRPSPSAHSARLADVVAEQRARLAGRSRDVELRLEASADLPAVALGPDQLHEVLAVLLDNACEAVEGKGRVTLTARLARLDEEACLELWGAAAPGLFVCVEVSDTGPGLAADARARLFREPFYTTKPRHRGLGLVIAYGILHCQRGGLHLQDNPGGGVLATAYLPVAAVGVEAPPPVSPTARRTTQEQPLRVPEKSVP